jgi:hypothetical protein
VNHKDVLGAALAYYSIFSLGPLMVIAIAIVGLVFGEVGYTALHVFSIVMLRTRGAPRCVAGRIATSSDDRMVASNEPEGAARGLSNMTYPPMCGRRDGARPPS